MTEETRSRLDKLHYDISDILFDLVDENETLEGQVNELREYVARLTEKQNKGDWIPLTKRPMTDEEREHYREWSDLEGAMIFDCPLPEDSQEVLVSYGGYVCTDTFCKDDGCYFEGVDIDEVEAWMPKPESYKGERSKE